MTHVHITELTFEIHMSVYDEYGDSQQVNQCFEVNRASGVITMTDLDCEAGNRYTNCPAGERTGKKIIALDCSYTGNFHVAGRLLPEQA